MNLNKPDIFGIGVESSCDESGFSLIKNGNEVISNPLFSQIDLHTLYGGVIPELASRAHLEKMPLLLGELIADIEKEYGNSKEFLRKIDYVAVTTRPGLTGSLLMGLTMAQALSDFLAVPLIGIHHLEAHLYASLFEYGKPDYPFLGILLSGGNTLFLQVEGVGQVKILADTLDDACGEALDKAATILNLGYPGGPLIEKKATAYLETVKNKDQERAAALLKNPLPLILKDKKKSDIVFSYSGLKTALGYLVASRKVIGLQDLGPQANDEELRFTTEALAFFFQERVFEIILRNLEHILEAKSFRQIIVAGGVAANKTLKAMLIDFCLRRGIDCRVPAPKYCTDNAAMIGACGYAYFCENKIEPVKKVSSDNRFEAGMV